jgi:hypothetical protein
MMPSVPLMEAGAAALPGEIGRDAPRELTAIHCAPAHMNKSLEERAKATALPSNWPPNTDTRSKGSVGHAGVMGEEV